MLLKKMTRIVTVFFMAISLQTAIYAQTVGIFFNSSVEQIKFAANDIKVALESKSFTIEMLPISSLNSTYANKKVVITLASDNIVTGILTSEGGTLPTNLGEQAYGLRTTTNPQTSFWVLGGDENGAMYGALELSESITANGLGGTYNKQESPFLLNRGMKLNMPLDRRIPTYVGGWSSTSTGLAIPHVWDMTFWKKLIDQQARYRYNVLSVWVHHPFPALVKVADYPNASLPRIEGFNGYVSNLNHEQRVAFWREVMQHAHNRGMKFYFFNWNVYLDYAKDQYSAITNSPTNTTTIDYMYKSMKALIETYPELDGFGISAGDGMNNFSDNTQKTKWTWDAMGKAVYDYLAENPNRKFNLIHRGIGSSAEVWNKQYAPLKTLTNATSNYSVKYAQAHMYSTPTPSWTTSSINTINSQGDKTWLTIRNDDYFYINWGDHKFVRDYMAGIPNKQAVTGMYIGSDGYTPSRTYLFKNPALNGQLEVERRWYMEMLWGRISYNPQISDDVFKNMLEKRFPNVSSSDLFLAWTLASRPLPRVTELIMDGWSLDFDWYPEGCNSDPGRCTGFRTVFDFANMSTHPNAKVTTVAKGSNLCDIPNSAAGTCGGKKSSYTVADEMQADAQTALTLVETMSSGGNPDLQMAINNIKQMAYLSLYYAYKVRGATFLRAGQTAKARDEMGMAYCRWISYTRSMEEDYIGTSFRNMNILPDWKYADAAVLKDYTDLGGIGVPICGDISYRITLSSTDNTKGTATGSGLYNPGDIATATAEPKAGYRFVKWTEDNLMVSSDISYKFTVDRDRTLTAYFIESNSCGFPWTDAGFTVNKATVTKTYGPIDVSCANGGVRIQVEVQGVGGDNSDYCKISYKLNDGPLQLVGDLRGAFALKTVTSNLLSGNKLEIIINSATTWQDEFYYITNVKVVDIISTSIDNKLSNGISIYPNPANKMLNIELSDAIINPSVKIFNSSGKLFYNKQLNQPNHKIDLESLNIKGLSFIQIITENRVYNQKIMIE